MNRIACKIDLSEPFGLGGAIVNPATGRIRLKDRSTKMPPQAIEVLLYLAERPAQVVSRMDLEDAVWHGRIVGYDSLTANMFKLRKALGDDSKNPQLIETVSKRGYRLLVPPHAVVNDRALKEIPVAGASSVERSGYSRLAWTYITAAVLAAFSLAALLFFYNESQKGTIGVVDGKRAIVFLPLKSIDSNSNITALADGLTDDLTIALAMYPGLLVISRDSAFLYKHDQLDLPNITRNLNVDLILNGTIREIGTDLRVNLHLIEARTGGHIWGQSFDSATQDFGRLGGRIVNSLLAVLSDGKPASKTEKKIVVGTSIPAAYHAFNLGRQRFFFYRNKSENAKARELFQEALEKDPNFAMAQAMLAWTYAFDAMNGWASNKNETLERAKSEATKAVNINADVPLSYFIRGLAFREQGEYVKAMVEAEKATQLDTNYANAQVLLATLLYYAGRPEASIERLKTAMLINPHHPFNYSFHLGQAYFTLGDYENAIKALQTGVDSNPASERLHVWLAAAYALAGRPENAKWEAEQVLTLNPQFSLSKISDAFPYKDTRDRDRFIEGLKRAGFT
jgi:DNA-binding winged helix-turn-helix (wHTH) protein/TolB-like protein/Tfp pilus assembly protein PilF